MKGNVVFQEGNEASGRAVIYERHGEEGLEWLLVRIWQNPAAGVPYRSFRSFGSSHEALGVARDWLSACAGACEMAGARGPGR